MLLSLLAGRPRRGRSLKDAGVIAAALILGCAGLLSLLVVILGLPRTQTPPSDAPAYVLRRRMVQAPSQHAPAGVAIATTTSSNWAALQVWHAYHTSLGAGHCFHGVFDWIHLAPVYN